MAQFNDAVEMDTFQERQCFLCVNWRDRDDGGGQGCPIWDLHLVYAGNENARNVLDYLIPMNNDELPSDCKIFYHYATALKEAGAEDKVKRTARSLVAQMRRKKGGYKIHGKSG